MEKIVGIVIPTDLKDEIINFGKRYGLTIVEPHITLISHELLKDAKSVERNLQSFCLSQPPFKAIVGGPNIEVGNNLQVFYLSVMMGALNSVREKLLKHLKLTPTGVFRPYVWIAEQSFEGEGCDFDQMLSEAKELFSKPRSIPVNALATYTGKDKSQSLAMSSTYQFTGR